MRAVVVLPLVPVTPQSVRARRRPAETAYRRRCRDVASLALARRDVHPKTGSGVYFADAAADRAITLGDVLREKVHTTHVEPDGAHRALRHLAVIG